MGKLPYPSEQEPPVLLWNFIQRSSFFSLRVKHPPFLSYKLRKHPPPDSGDSLCAFPGPQPTPVCHRAPSEAHSFARWGRFLSRRKKGEEEEVNKHTKKNYGKAEDASVATISHIDSSKKGDPWVHSSSGIERKK